MGLLPQNEVSRSILWGDGLLPDEAEPTLDKRLVRPDIQSNPVSEHPESLRSGPAPDREAAALGSSCELCVKNRPN